MTIKKVKAKDPGSSITHLIGTLMAVFSAIPLLLKVILLSTMQSVIKQ